jgi:hypothetical protein
MKAAMNMDVNFRVSWLSQTLGQKPRSMNVEVSQQHFLNVQNDLIDYQWDLVAHQQMDE